MFVTKTGLWRPRKGEPREDRVWGVGQKAMRLEENIAYSETHEVCSTGSWGDSSVVELLSSKCRVPSPIWRAGQKKVWRGTLVIWDLTLTRWTAIIEECSISGADLPLESSLWQPCRKENMEADQKDNSGSLIGTMRAWTKQAQEDGWEFKVAKDQCDVRPVFPTQGRLR